MRGAFCSPLAVSVTLCQSCRPASKEAESRNGGVQVLGSSSLNASGFNTLIESLVRKLNASTRNPLANPSVRSNRNRMILVPPTTAPSLRGRVTFSVGKPPPIPP